MTLNIVITGLSSSEATEVIKTCQESINAIEDIRSTPPTDASAEPIHVEFKYEQEQKIAFRGEESTFSRYLNSTTKTISNSNS